MKIEFLSHYGSEYYCPLSLVRVYGMSMLEYYNRVERQGEDEVEEQHLWPSEIREQLIQPQFDVVNTSESFPIKHDDHDETLEHIIPPIKSDSSAQIELSVENDDDDVMEGLPHLYEEEELLDQEEMTTTVIEQVVVDSASNEGPLLTPSVTPMPSTTDGTPSAPSTFSSSLSQDIPIIIDSNGSIVDEKTDTTTDITIHSNDDDIGDDANAKLNHTSTNVGSQEVETRVPTKVIMNNNHGKEKSQESIYKTIMKRLNALELNATLSKRYLDDQNEMLNQVFLDMERRHQEQLIVLIGQLNETASYKIESMVRFTLL
jgi:hypothetical protein